MAKKLNSQKLNYNFPSPEILTEIREKFTDPEYLDRNLVLVGNFSNLDKIKFGICQAIINYKLDNQIDEKQLAQILELEEGSLKNLLHLNINDFSLDSLLNYTERLQAPLQVNIDLMASSQQFKLKTGLVK